MLLTREQKVEQVKIIKDKIKKSSSIIVWDYFKNDAKSISTLKTNVSSKNAEDIVYKNRIAKIAFQNSGKKEIVEHLKGPSSFLFIYDEESNALKELNDFFKSRKNYSFKAGYIDGKFYTAESIKEIASLPSKNELLSMLLSVLEGSMRNFAYVLSQVEKTKK